MSVQISIFAGLLIAVFDAYATKLVIFHRLPAIYSWHFIHSSVNLNTWDILFEECKRGRIYDSLGNIRSGSAVSCDRLCNFPFMEKKLKKVYNWLGNICSGCANVNGFVICGGTFHSGSASLQRYVIGLVTSVRGVQT